MTTVSVVLPTYNRDAFLPEAVESVVRQSCRDWELIIVDDGSTDGTRSYLSTLRDPRVRVRFLEHTGSPPKARNAGLASATGEWIAFLDSDDVWHPDKLMIQLASLAECPQCGWGCAGVSFMNAAGARIPQRAGLPYSAQSGWILERLIVGQATVSIPTLIVRRALLEHLGGMDESLTYFDDLDLVLRLAARSEMRASAAVLATIRDYDGRTTGRERPSELFRYKERAYRKAASAARSQSIRLSLRRCCAITLVEMAHALSVEGSHDAALDASHRAMFDAPLAPHVWRAVVGSHWRRFKSVSPTT